MNDDRANTRPAQPIHVDHYCSHPECKRWGSFGYSSGKEAPKWFCGEHRPDREAIKVQ